MLLSRPLCNLVLFGLLISLCTVDIDALDNGQALLPPMGFANWNGFGCNYDDQTFRNQSDYLVSSGLAAAGYRVLIIQECITKAGHRDSRGVPQPDPVKFPHGIKGLCDYIHSKDLLCGIYTDVGPETCAGYEGSYNHEVVDAQTYASWGVDFVEEDSCHHGDIKPYIPYQVLYGRMRDALNATGRPVTFYMCVQGQEDVHRWGAATGNLWRTTGDICGPGHATWRGVMNNFYGNARWPNASSPGAWQDPDMLVVGMPIDGKMDNHTLVQWRTHFSLWAMAAAPLWIGIDMTKMPESALAVFSNAAVIAVDQDPLGRMATCRSPGGCPPPGSPAGQRLGYHRCDAVMRWSYTQDTGVFTVLDGAALTAKSCAPEPAGDPMIVWPEVVPETCGGQKPGNQAFVVNASGLVILQSGLCVAPDASNAPVSGPCSSPAARVVWDASLGQLRTQDGDQPVCLGVPAAPPGEVQVWARPLAPSERSRHRAAVALFNPSESGHGNVTVTWSQVGLVDGTAARATDLWTGTVTTSSEGYAASDVGPQAVVMLLVEQ